MPLRKGTMGDRAALLLILSAPLLLSTLWWFALRAWSPTPDHRRDVAVFFAGYAFTMLGFVAAIVTVLISIGRTRTMRYYARHGGLGGFKMLYTGTILELFALFIVSAIVVVMPAWHSLALIRVAPIFFSATVISLALMIWLIIKLAYDAANEAS